MSSRAKRFTAEEAAKIISRLNDISDDQSECEDDSDSTVESEDEDPIVESDSSSASDSVEEACGNSDIDVHDVSGTLLLKPIFRSS